MLEAVRDGWRVRLTVDAPYAEVGAVITVRCTVGKDAGLRSAPTASDQQDDPLQPITLTVNECFGPVQEVVDIDELLQTSIRPEETLAAAWRVPVSVVGLGEIRGCFGNGDDALELTEYLPVLTEEPRARLDEAALGNGVDLRNEWIRWVCPRQPYGYPVGFLYVREQEGWVRRGSSGLIGRLIAGSARSPQAVALLPQSVQAGTDGLSAELTAEGQSQRVAWSAPSPATVRLAVAYRLEAQAPRMTIDYQASTDTPLNLCLLDGPTVILEDDQREEGLFPGLEWLVDHEVSSSEVDVHGPEHLRMSPHELKITWPLMALRLRSTVVSLLWDQRAAWNGDDAGYAAQFSSPDAWYGTAPRHRMALALPGGARYHPHENNQLAETYRWAPATRLQATATLAVRHPASSVLSALEEWAAVYGLPSAMVPPFDYATEWSLAREAYAEHFWDAGAEGWGHVLGWTPQYFPAYAFLAAMLAGGRQDQTASRLQAIVKAGEAHLRPQDPLPGGGVHIPGLEPAFLYGEGAEALSAAHDAALKLLAEQAGDGNWTFAPASESEKTLGPVGAKAVGITATKAETLLQLGKLLGAGDLVAGGLKALAAMRDFRVPRAAQVWECPVHTPDILAAARAVDAYLVGYQLTGQTAYLDDARYWAMSGLPFLYVWEWPDRPVMRWASIAIFGATFFTMSWLGRPVQWNGMVYADSVLRLAPYDASWPWTEIGRGIFHSALHQQRLARPGRGGYPDSWYLPDNTPVQGVDINPETLVKVLLRLMGLPATLETVVLGDRARVSTVGRMVVGTDGEGAQTLTVSGWQGSHRRLLVAGEERQLGGAEAFRSGKWRPARSITQHAPGFSWVDWGEDIPARIRVRFDWQ